MSSNKTLSSFIDKKLYSKKEWLLPNNILFFISFITPIIILFLFFDLYKNTLLIKYNKLILITILLITSIYIADFISAYAHCYYIDNSYRYKKFDIKDNYMIINTNYGYASCHHIFPSNWKDIKDSTIINTTIFLLIVPFLIVYFFINNPIIKILCYFIFLFLIVTPISHKYSHEKLHHRYSPFIVDFLIKYGIFLYPKKHENHHIENNYNWGLLNGISDLLFNFIINNMCYYNKQCPTEEMIYNGKLLNTDIINIRFVGDIEGTLQCKLVDNLYVDV